MTEVMPRYESGVFPRTLLGSECRTFLSSKLQNLMVVTVGMDGGIDLLEKLGTVASQEVHAADSPFLQAFLGIERLAERLRVTSDQLALPHFRARSLCVETFQLMLHFRSRGLRRVHQGGIKLGQLLADVGEACLERFLGLIERSLQISRQVTRGQPLP